MARESLQLNLPPSEVKVSHRDDGPRIEAVKELHHVPLRQAKAQMGAAIRVAIGDAAYKAYGHEGLVSAVCSGEKVPDYLGRIYQDDDARRRLGFALLKGDPAIRCRMVIEWDEEKVG